MLNGAVKGKRYVEMIKQMVAKKSTIHATFTNVSERIIIKQRMKTAEEKANEYLCKSIGVSLGSPLNAAYNGFIAGYAEAMRWRDPANEPPKCNELMQIKYSDIFSDTVAYSHDRYLEDAGMWEIEQFANILVLGWRPIK